MFHWLTVHVEGGASIIQKTPVTTKSVAAATISEVDCHLWKCDKLFISSERWLSAWSSSVPLYL